MGEGNVIFPGIGEIPVKICSCRCRCHGKGGCQKPAVDNEGGPCLQCAAKCPDRCSVSEKHERTM